MESLSLLDFYSQCNCSNAINNIIMRKYLVGFLTQRDHLENVTTNEAGQNAANKIDISTAGECDGTRKQRKLTKSRSNEQDLTDMRIVREGKAR